MSEKIFACVLKSGGIYTPEWVVRLCEDIDHTISVPFRLVCLSDYERSGGDDTIPLKFNYPGWWSKIELFRPGLFDGQVMFLDLDVIVIGDLAEIVSAPHHFTMCQDYYRRHWFCSTAMCFDGSRDWGIQETFGRNASQHMRTYAGGPGRKLGDQGFIEDHLRRQDVRIDSFQQRFGEKAIASYKVDGCKDCPPHGAKVVAFHGKPKPHEIKGGWVAEAWQGKL